MQMQNIFSTISLSAYTNDFFSNADLKCDDIYKNSSFRQFHPICCASKNIVKMVLRSKFCKKTLCSDCIYSSEYLVQGQKQNFECKLYPDRPFKIDQLYIDMRLTNLITSFLEQLKKDKKESQQLLRMSTICVNREGQLYIKVGNQTFMQRTNNATTGGKLTEESATESKIEIQSTIRRKCYDYLDSKQKLGMLTNNLQGEALEIKEKFTDKLIDQIIKKAPCQRKKNNKVADNGCLFGFVNGRLFCGPGTSPIKQYTVVHGDQTNKKALATFYGGSWFFAQINKIQCIFVVGGSSTFSSDKVGRNVMEFRLDIPNQQAIWTPKLIKQDNEKLNLFHAGVICINTTVWILGGLTKKENKGVPSKIIYKMEIKESSKIAISEIGETLKEPRINQSYTYSNGKIYIACGLLLKDWETPFSLDEPMKTIKSTHSEGNYNPLRLEVFDTVKNNIKSFNINLENNRVESYIYRCLSGIIPVPSKKTNIMIVFGGNPQMYGQGEHAIAFDLKATQPGSTADKVFAKDFGDDLFKREVFVGNQFPISKHANGGVNNIVDLQGIRSQNFSEWVCVTSQGDIRQGGKLKVQQFALTSQESDFGYRWRF